MNTNPPSRADTHNDRDNDAGIDIPSGSRAAENLPGDKAPFWGRPASRPGAPPAGGALCLHGFSGTPFEVRPLAEDLVARGFVVSAPLLAGHGDTVEALGRSRWPDWLASAERALLDLRASLAADIAPGSRPPRIAIAGFSCGGLLALRLARRYPDLVGALAVMAAPLRLRRYERTALRAIVRLPRALRRGWLVALPKLKGFDVTDPEAQRRNPGLPALPLDAAASLLDLGDVVRQDLPFIHTPLLVAHGERDRTVPIEDSLELAGTVGARELQRLWLPASGHLLAIDVERRRLLDAVGAFFHKHLQEAIS